MISISVVSHGQGSLIKKLLKDLNDITNIFNIEVILTINIIEEIHFGESEYNFNLLLINNDKPKGFGENHNYASNFAKGNFFCVCNPDIRIDINIWSELIKSIGGDNVGVVSPIVYDFEGNLSDAARYTPTLSRLLKKILFNERSSAVSARSHSVQEVEWLGGMFLFFRLDLFRQINGFDERFFMYYEDVDLCMRLRSKGYICIVNHNIHIYHEGQKKSRTVLRHAKWHLASMMRFLFRYYTGCYEPK